MEAELESRPSLLGAATDRATSSCPTAAPGDTAGEVREGLMGTDLESVGAVAVLDERRLVGLIPILRLLAAPADAPLEAIMDPDPPAVSPGEDQESIAWKMIRHGEASLPIVDDDGEFVGLIPAHDLLEVLMAEHDEDLARIGGYLAGASQARSAAEEPMGQRLWHRLPWLLVGLIGAMASAVLVGSFEAELQQTVLLAFFLPGIVYLADAVGTQTETVLIRGFSVGIEIHRAAWRELVTGSIIGGLVGLVFFPFALVGWGDTQVAAAVALALFAACTIATAVGVVVPWAFHRAGLDPAFGSGPLGTVIQDLLSIAVYFAIAIPLAT